MNTRPKAPLRRTASTGRPLAAVLLTLAAIVASTLAALGALSDACRYVELGEADA